MVLLGMRTEAPLDLLVYRGGAEALLAGQDVYGQTYSGAQLTFTYPPFALLFFVPLVWLGQGPAAVMVLLTSLLGLAVLVHLAVGRARLGWAAATLLLLACAVAEPVWLTLHFGQINLVLAALVAADLVPGRERWWRGAGLGIAAGIKLSPLTFVAWLLLTRQWRAAGVAVGTFLGTVVLSFLLVPGAARSFWFGAMPAATGGEPTDMSAAIAHSMPKEYVGNQSVMGVMARAFGPDTGAATLGWLLVGGVVALAAVGVGALITLRGERGVGFWVAALAMVLASPVAWTHHWVWAVCLAIALWEAAPRLTGVLGMGVEHLRVLAAGIAVVLVADMHWWSPGREMQELDWNLMQVLIGNDYVITGVVTIALLGWAVLRAGLVGPATVPGRSRS
ncbi:alpha-1,2-mannosyltransferase [Kytococcus aerolatus]|uniref:Alpha-1,2-mannosyltransferase n=2 Tax=Kytococcus aerolatus TaxID=592308 RepID=A0A212TBE6_9MICO|nr:alpha-1,2-mannosyltransferase [Kytococcus aerolatus]